MFDDPNQLELFAIPEKSKTRCPDDQHKLILDEEASFDEEIFYVCCKCEYSQLEHWQGKRLLGVDKF